MVSACHGAPPARAGRLELTLSPASFGRTLSLQQQVHVEYATRTVDLDAILEITPDSLTLVGMAFGQRMLTLRYDGVTLREQRHPMLPRDVRGADILTDLQMALWPAGAVRAALPPGWTLTDSDTLRTLSKDSREMVTISSDAVPRWKSVVTLRNLEYDYRLVIRSATEDP
ncbi:MAG: DUF3261 domain-containing protein [Gemmatimonadaceae bacterium]